MRRRLFNLAAAVSLVLFIATAASWLRSQFRADGIQHRTFGPGGTPRTFHTVAWNSGRFRYRGDFWQVNAAPSEISPPSEWQILSRPATGRIRIVARWENNKFYFLGFGANRGGGAYYALGRPLSTSSFGLTIPHWFVLLLLALAPARRAAIKCREIRRRSGRGEHCGYDLRATPDRCPECGTAASGDGRRRGCGQ